jgi:hypothetical protein
MTDSPARQVRNALLGMEAEGWRGWRTFDALWVEALNRVWVVEEEHEMWMRLLDEHRGAWSEAWFGPDFWECSAVIVAALERLATREHVS